MIGANKKAFALGGLFVMMPQAYSQKKSAKCMTAEEEAAELQKILDGQVPSDPEEMQEMIMKARGQTKSRQPPEFMRLTGPLKMITMFRPNDGLILTGGIPFSQRFQTSFTWSFSNKKAADFEMMCMLAGGGSMMDQDSMSFLNVSTSSGRLSIQGQKPLGHGVKISTEVEMGSLDPNMCMTAFTLKKDFKKCHLQYSYQGIHMLNFMQSITKELSAGFSAAYIPMHNRTIFSYGGRFDHADNTFLSQYNPMHPQEKFLIGVISRPSRRLNLFAEFKIAPDNKSDLVVGCRTKFQEGMVTSTISTSGKATSVYRKFVDQFEVTFTGSMDLSKPQQPAAFGLSLGLGGGM